MESGLLLRIWATRPLVGDGLGTDVDASQRSRAHLGLATLLVTIVVSAAGCASGATPNPPPKPSPTVLATSEFASPGASRSSGPAPTSTQASTAYAVPDRWTRLSASGTPPEGMDGIGGVVFHLGGRFMITLNQKVWTSSDGWAWDRQPDLPDADAFIKAVSAGGPGFVAVGAAAGAAAAWTSLDGTTWMRAPDVEASSGAFMTAVVSGARGLVAVGDGMAKGVPHTMIWASPDGRSWRRIADQASFTRGDIWGVARGGPGYVAVGGRNCSTLCPEPGPPIWTSADGWSWHFLDARSFSAATPGLAYAVGALGPLVVAVGLGDDGHAAVARAWSSSDGVHWTSRVIGPSGNGPMAITAIGQAGLVAVGQGIWTTVDGQTWRSASSIEPYGSEELRSVACGADRCVAVGGDASGAAEIWLGPARAAP